MAKTKNATSFVAITIADILKHFPKDATILISRIQLQKQIGYNLTVSSADLPVMPKINSIEPLKPVEAKLTTFVEETAEETNEK